MLKLVPGLLHLDCICSGPRICNVESAEKVEKDQWLQFMQHLIEVVNKMMRSFVGSSVCHFLSNLHPFEHKIFLARHGESDLAA